MPESPEGQLKIHLHPDSSGSKVEIDSSRAVHASQIFVGKPVEKTIETIPLLFNICGNAQLVCALRAIEGQIDKPASQSAEEWREALILLETLREQLWRILLEWPQLSDYVADTDRLSKFNRTLNSLIQSLKSDPGIASPGASRPKADIDKESWQSLCSEIEQTLFAGPVEKWLENSGICSLEVWCDKHRSLPSELIRDIFDKRWHSIGFSDYLPLSDKLDSHVHKHLLGEDADHFIKQPVLEKTCLETGPLSRHDEHPMIEDLLYLYGNGLLTRLVARLVDVADALQRLGRFFTQGASLTYQRARNGIASVEAARGRLTHHVELEDEKIRQYRILAPTEWNFHPEGIVSRGLASLKDAPVETLRRQSSILIHAIDPCVGYDLVIDDANA